MKKVKKIESAMSSFTEAMIGETTYKLVRFENVEYILEDHKGGFSGDALTLYLPIAFVNEWKAFAMINDSHQIIRYHKEIGKLADIEIIKDLKNPTRTFKELKLKTKDVEFKDWIGKKLESVKEVDFTIGFWGDDNQTFLFKFEGGEIYLGEASGGSNLFGFPGSMSHGFSLEKILNPELLDHIIKL